MLLGGGGGLPVILTAYFDETKNVIPSSQWGSMFYGNTGTKIINKPAEEPIALRTVIGN